MSETLPETFHRVGPETDIAENSAIGVVLAGWPVLIARTDGKLHAVIDRCTHASSELSTGRVRRGSIMCPLHGARFELASGKCIGGAYKPLMTFPLRVVDGFVEVAVPAEAPGAEHLPVRARA